MESSINSLDVESLYDLLKISSKGNELIKNSFSDSKENDEHLAWKPLKI